MRAIELFPYWADNRALLVEIIRPLKDHDLEFRPAPGLRTLGEILRHTITAEEAWWHSDILGEPYDAYRPAGWAQYTDDQREAYRARRFPTVQSILEGLQAAHEPVEQFLATLDAASLCERRGSPGEKDNTLRWIFWHLVEHDQHHRGQVFTRVRLLGHQPPSTFPRPEVMGSTPAAAWKAGEEEARNIVPFWNPVQSSLREAVAALSPADLAFRPAEGLPSIHDLILHIFVWEDFLIRQNLKGEMDQAWWKIVPSLGHCIGERFPTVSSLLEGLDTVHAATEAFLTTLTLQDLPKTHPTPWGEETLHHTLWYAREHTVHHRAQLFFRMRMLGRIPPEI